MTAYPSIPGLDGAIGDAIHHHVFSNADREVGGVLIGRVGRHGGPPLVLASIEAMNAGEARASLTFTQDTWTYVHSVIERDYAEDQIVGWYHSHPGFGIFLSEHDLFIHRNFFSDASQIALVVDPLAGTEGVFGWQDGEIVSWYERPTSRAGLGRPPAPPGSQPLGTRRLGWSPLPGAAEPEPKPRVVELTPPSEAAPATPRALAALERRPHRLIAAGVGLIVGVLLWEGVLRSDAGATSSPNWPAHVVLVDPGRSQPTAKPPTEERP